jgi:hypothetical protein
VPHVPYITDAGLVQARANALRLLRRWDIHGAAAALAHVPEERSGEWGKVINRFDTFMAGLGKGDPGHQAFHDALKTFVSNPLNWGKKYVRDGNLRENNQDVVALRFLLPGLRAESSLRNERWVEALNWTYTYYDAMLVDLIELYCRTLNNFIKIEGKVVRFLGNCPISSALIASTRIDSNWFFVGKQNKINYDDDYVNKNSQKAFNKSEIESILSGCKDQWIKAFEAYQQCKNLRNQNTHKVLQPSDVNELSNKMTRVGLWEENGLTVVGTALAKGCLTTFKKQNCVSEIEALHAAAVKALIES